MKLRHITKKKIEARIVFFRPTFRLSNVWSVDFKERILVSGEFVNL